jgi:hypothetical protein
MKLLIANIATKEHLYTRFSESIRNALIEIGHEATLSQHEIGQVSTLARELNAEKYDAVLSFSSAFGDAGIIENEQSLFDILGVKFLGWQLDHPIYVYHALSKKMENRRSIYANYNNQRFAEAVKVSGKSLSLLPGATPFEGRLKAHKSREWPIFLAATWNGPPERVWEQLQESPAKRLFVAVVDQLRESPEVSVLDAFVAAAGRLGISAKLGVDPKFDETIIQFLRGPLTYVRNNDRVNIVKSLIDSGLPITICGSGWRNYLGDPDNITFLDSVSFEKLSEFYNNSKVVLNINAGNGGSERAFYAAASGAAVVSDWSGDLGRCFADGDEIAFFNRVKPASVVDRVGELLEGGRSESVGQAGHERVMDSNLWRHRAEAVVAFLS